MIAVKELRVSCRVRGAGKINARIMLEQVESETYSRGVVIVVTVVVSSRK